MHLLPNIFLSWLLCEFVNVALTSDYEMYKVAELGLRADLTLVSVGIRLFYRPGNWDKKNLDAKHSKWIDSNQFHLPSGQCKMFRISLDFEEVLLFSECFPPKTQNIRYVCLLKNHPKTQAVHTLRSNTSVILYYSSC